ncbi:MAG TPA: thiamine pyrophosphate-binding protein [Acidimicrobiales bacterium]|nr:thiamine pyrophosphate-binding protein [Acidimicrobiales bacterium]
MVRMRGSEMIAEYLQREGVRHVFALCGHGNVGLLDALLDARDRLSVVSVHHEAAAGFMADAYFRVARRPAVTLTSCGPGSANLVIALAGALFDSSAFLAITGNIPTTQFNRGAFQETGRYFQADFPSVVRPYVKRSFQATRPEQLPLMLRQAFSTMLTGRPGPANLDVPLDVFVEEAEVELPEPSAWRRGISSRVGVAPEDLETVVELLVTAERPLAIAGHGVEVAGAAAALVEVSRLLGLPVAWSPSAKGCFDPASELAVGEVGRNGGLPANRAASTADVILAVGTRFDDRAASSWIPGYTYRIPPTKLIHVDIDPQELGRNYPVELGIVADARAFLRALAVALAGRADLGAADARRAWRSQIASWRRDWERTGAEHARSEATPIRPERLLHDLRRVLPADGILVSDVGVHHNWIVQAWQAPRPASLLQSWGFGAMGFGVAGVLGAKLAAPDRPVAAVVGDGGFLMLPGAVATAVEYGIPVTWVVWNNGGYISIRDIQRGYFGPSREFATSFAREDGQPYSADYAAMARAMGAEGLAVEKPGELAEALAAAIESGRPSVVSVVVDPEASPLATGSWALPPLPHPQPSSRRDDVVPPGRTDRTRP